MYDIFDRALDSVQFRDALGGQHPSQGRRAWLRRVSRSGCVQRQYTAGVGRHTRPVMISSLSDLDIVRVRPGCGLGVDRTIRCSEQ